MRMGPQLPRRRHGAIAAAVLALGAWSAVVAAPAAHATTTTTTTTTKCSGRTPTHTMTQDDSSFHAGRGDDVIAVYANYTTVYGGPGNDRICVFHGSGGSISGGPGNDRIRGRAVVTNGNGGNDIIHSKSYSFGGAPHGVHVDLKRGTATGYGHDRLIGVHYVSGSSHADVIKGTRRSDDLAGGGGRDLLIGRGGADTLRDNRGTDISKGAGGPDLIFDGPGNDQLNGGGGDNELDVYDASNTGVTVNLARHRATSLDLGTDKLANIEDISGSFFDDTLIGDAQTNTINGDYGDDTVYGNGGDDTIDGGIDNDHLFGGGGNDTVQGNYGIDVLHGGDGNDQLYGAGYVEGFDIADSDEDNSTVYGDDGDDTLVGEAGDADHLDGGPGADSADGRNGLNDDCLAETTVNCEAA
jgi:Ca2+-binding RTX toxin-like protein